MTPRGARVPAAERLYGMLLRLYPPALRAAYGGEMLGVFADWRAAEATGVAASVRFWGRVLLDLARSVPREWASELSEWRSRREPAPHPPPYAAAALAGLAVFALYAATLAPTVAFWDAGEYIAVAHVLGIPHPPGSPLFVLLAGGWELLLAPTGLSTAVRINLFAATLAAAAHGLWFLVVHRALAGWSAERGLRLGGAAVAVALSATAFTVWNQSNVNEKVYAISFLTTALVSWLALRWRDTGRRPRRLLLIVFLLALTSTNHLMGVLVAPALAAFVYLVDRTAVLRPRFWLMALPLVAIAFSPHFFLPLRAAQQPLISEGAPACDSAFAAAASVYSWGRTGCEPLSAVLTREQYAKPSILLDPTAYPRAEVRRGAELVAAQFVNYAQYFDWQWARSVAGADPLFGGARPLVTLLVLLLGLHGARTHWRADRQGAAYLGTLFLTLSAGLVVYLNFRYGYSIARERFADPAMHEVRERDYFYLISFSVWGLWAGTGLADLWRRGAQALRRRVARPRLAAAPVLLLAAAPLLANWSWATRADDYTARDWAYNALMSVEPYGVLVTNGDNDSFPLWYLQKVEGVRRDVTIVLAPYLNAAWYVKQLRELTRPCAPGEDPLRDRTRIVCQRPFEPHALPDPLVRAGWARDVQPPRDSIVPLSDDEIDRMVATYVVADRPMSLRAGGLETRIAPGTTLLPADTFAAAILTATLGARPVHFMPGSPIVHNLGLFEHTVRQGVTWKIAAAPLPADVTLVRLPESALSPIAGAAIDLALTETLVAEVYLKRGRVLDPSAPWVDAAAATIPMQYVYAHYAAAQAHAQLGDAAGVERHLRDAAWWEAVVGG